MSLTEVCSAPSKISIAPEASTSTIFLTPRKRRRQSPEAPAPKLEKPYTNEQLSQENRSLRSRLIESRKATSHSTSELYKWTFSQASVAPVRARHVFDMDLEGEDIAEFYWMGRVPCRSVKVVGIVVGIDEFDDMTRFKLDDGTAVVDCDFKHPKQSKQRASPKAKIVKAASKCGASGIPNPPSSAHVQPDMPKVFVGTILAVRGRIFHGRGTRYLRLELGSFEVCDPNEELHHWMEVLCLCNEHYYLPEPFVIPKIERQPEQATASTNSSTPVHPSSPVSASSPTTSESSRAPTTSPRHPRLRHPSRLHSRDLTDIIFRIYLKHYLDFAPPYQPTRNTHDDSEDDTTNCNNSCVTPTPKSRFKRCSSTLETPKPHRRILSVKQAQEDEFIQHGFTLSYLRRVPVLAEMARAVVYAEARRREKRTREKERNSQVAQVSCSSFKPSSSSASRTSSHSLLDSRLVSQNMKRLFQKTIRDLYRDGSIIIWTGPARPCEHAFHAGGGGIGGSGSLWKTSTKDATLSSTISTSTRRSYSKATQDEDLSGYLSEPDGNEESYLSVTPRTISPFVFQALRRLTGLEDASRAPSRKRSRAPTVDELTAHLRNSDAQWANLGSWDVQSALEWLENEERVFKAGGGRWAVCS